MLNWAQSETQWRTMAMVIESQWQPRVADDSAEDEVRETGVFEVAARVVRRLSRRTRGRSY